MALRAIIIIILRLQLLHIFMCVCVCVTTSRIKSAVLLQNSFVNVCGFNNVHETKLYLISSRDSTAIAFKQDESCFHVLFCYQTSSESGETAIVSYKNCHNFITQLF